MDQDRIRLIAELAFKIAELEREMDALKRENEQLKAASTSSTQQEEVDLPGVSEGGEEEEPLEEAVVRPWFVSNVESRRAEACRAAILASANAIVAAECAVIVAKAANEIAAITNYMGDTTALEAILAIYVKQSASAAVSATLNAARAATGPTTAAVAASTAAAACSIAASVADKIGRAAAAVDKKTIFASAPIRAAIARTFARAAAQFATTAAAAKEFDEEFISSGDADAFCTVPYLIEAEQRLCAFAKEDAFYVPTA